MNAVAIITARGGSKRIPKKNIKIFLGKPIIAYSIETALKSNLFDEVMVSTDDVEIAEIAKKYGAKIPFMRSAQNADDFAGTAEVIIEVLDCYKKNNINFNYACCIYPTAPLITTQHLTDGLQKLIKKDFNTVFPVISFSYPIWRGLYINDNDLVNLHWPQYLQSRSQDLSTVYHDAGQWYWINTKKFSGNLYADNSSCIILPEEEVQDIDNLSDWKIAEIKYTLGQNNK